MEEFRLPAGTRVVDLGGLAVSASVASGAVAGAWIRWWIMGGWSAVLVGLLTGAVLGFIIGRLWARARYRSGDNTTMVVVGRASLSMSIPAAVVGSVATTLLIALLSSMIVATLGQALPLYAIAVGCGVVVGVAMACVASLG